MENKRTETNKTVQKRLEPELKLINMDTVEVEQIEWLLYPFIPYGKVTIIQGDPGEGKTTMVLQIIAKLTKGETILPADSTKDKRIDIDSESDMVDAENIENNASTQHLEAPVNVIYQTAEDGLGDTIKPRLLAAGADCTKVMVIDDSEQPLTMADELFFQLLQYFLMENYEGEEIIRKGLEKKLNAMVDRELYSKYKTAPTEEEREKSRQEYLERKGIPENFRW